VPPADETMIHPNPRRAHAWVLSIASAVACAPISAFAADYPSTVIADQPLAYHRFQAAVRTNLNLNAGSIGAAGNATNFNVHPVGGGLAGSRDGAAYFNGSRTIIPHQAALNPAGNKDFTIEAWIQPTVEVTDSPGPSPLMNRYSYSGVNRQGWVFFQRSPATGWNFRTYIGSGSSTGINITGQASGAGAGTAGTWNHVVVVYEGATTTATMYVNGEQVAQGTGGYAANTDDHGAEAVRGAAGLSIGSYNNTEPGSNPFTGAVDEVALYTTQLTAAQVLSHYQNGTNSLRATPYDALVLASAPAAYLRLGEASPDTDVAVNFGSAGVAGNGLHAPGVDHPVSGAVAGTADTAARYRSRVSGGGVQTLVPWSEKLNPPADQSFAIESWFQPGDEVTDSPGPAPIMNRYSYSGVNRQGWVYFQRSPTTGWNFRTYTGSGSSTGINITGQASNADAGKKGTWNHVVTVWDGPSKTATMYVNGEQVAQGTGDYQANTDDHGAEAVNGAAGLAIGSYNNTQLGDNAYNGAVAEVALYGDILSAAQVAAHYKAGTNGLRDTAYAAVVGGGAPGGGRRRGGGVPPPRRAGLPTRPEPRYRRWIGRRQGPLRACFGRGPGRPGVRRLRQRQFRALLRRRQPLRLARRLRRARGDRTGHARGMDQAGRRPEARRAGGRPRHQLRRRRRGLARHRRFRCHLLGVFHRCLRRARRDLPGPGR